ncbi:MAG: divalent-cation tolerance protein CutA [Candidatus Omnitrophota bacterium]
MYNIIFVTVPNKKEADKISFALVSQRLAACVNILSGVRSVYRWQGKVESSKELLLIIKTNSLKVRALIKKVRSMHSYDVPEIIAVPITAGSSDYLEWINDSVR